MAKRKTNDYGMGAKVVGRPVRAPSLPYEPRSPRHYNPGIGLIGCGGISVQHLRAYKKAGFRVLAVCDRKVERAFQRQKEFYPKAAVYADYKQVLARDDIEVVDIATHPGQRQKIIESSILAGKHVLSQKPFTTDLSFGRRMVKLAAKRKVKLAVNTNGRWAPHFSYIRHVIRKGLIGDVLSVQCTVSWNHNWVAGTEFNRVRHIILYDFGIHWFDLLTCFFGRRSARRVFASFARSRGQKANPPLLGQALIEYDHGQAVLAFNGDTKIGAEDRTYIVGSAGAVFSGGPDLASQKVTLQWYRGVASPKLKGHWFPDGFRGTMGELLCAIEEDREPENNALSHMRGLELCFAAVASAESHRPFKPGSVRRMPS
ncbi:MAG TPA: Gfo/Idh/MocA family oxidoreductase [Acidobacteriota bacterium]|jgi:predicted dehydrogenase